MSRPVRRAHDEIVTLECESVRRIDERQAHQVLDAEAAPMDAVGRP